MKMSSSSDMVKDSQYCSFCGSSQHEKFCLPSSLTTTDNQSILSRDQFVILALKHVLELPSEQLEIYQRHCPSPEKWINICSVCGESLDKFKNSLLGLLAALKELQDLKNGFIERVKKAVTQKKKEEQEEDSDDDVPAHSRARSQVSAEGHIYDITQEIRRFIRQHDYDFKSYLDPFLTNQEYDLSFFLNKPSRLWTPLAVPVKKEEEENLEELTRGSDVQDNFLRDPLLASPNLSINSGDPLAQTSNSKAGSILASESDGGEDDDDIESTHDDEEKEGESGEEDYDANASEYSTDEDESDDALSEIEGGFSDSEEEDLSNAKKYSPKKGNRKKTPATRSSISAKSKKALSTNLQNPIPLKSRIFNCNICPELTDMKLMRFLQHFHYHRKFVYECTICNEKFTGHDFFNTHWRKYHEKSFPNSPDFSPFKRNISPPFVPEVPWWCVHCNLKFPSEDLRDIHSTTSGCHSPSSTLKEEEEEQVAHCQYCRKSYSDPDELKLHERTFHLDEQLFCCKKCPEVFFSKEVLDRHEQRKHTQYLRRHQIEKTYPCTVDSCKIVSKNAYQLRLHMREHRKSPLIKCQFCGKSFLHNWKLMRHEKRHNNTLTKPYQCDLCTSGFKTMRELNTHKKKKHDQANKNVVTEEDQPSEKEEEDTTLRKPEKTVVCEICGGFYESESSLKMHKYRKHPTPEQLKHECESCGKLFVNEHLLKLHHGKYHQPKPPEVCEICGKVIGSRKNMWTHVKYVHSTEKRKSKKRHYCTEPGCTRSYKFLWVLNEHRTQHSGNPGFKCRYCGKGFHFSAAWRQHEKALHVNKDTKPFECEQCGKQFASNRYLTLHKKTHAKDK